MTSTMPTDIWSEPLADPIVNTVDLKNEGETRPRRRSLFLSDSDDEDTGSRHHANARAASPFKGISKLDAAEKSKLDAIFADLDDDDDVFTVEPALDVEKMKRQVDAQVAVNMAAKNVIPSLTPYGAGGSSSTTQDKDKDNDVKKARRAVPKLDEERLLGADGFPRLIKDSKIFKITGKGHEAADLERLFRLYHGWTHKMYPKFQFKDTVDRVEKLCRSRRMAVNLRAWKDEANGIVPHVRHEITQDDDERGDEGDQSDAVSTHGQAAGVISPSSSRPNTPVTRPGSAASTAPSVPSSATDNDAMNLDIDTLLREEEEILQEMRQGSIGYKPPDQEDDEDVLWAASGGTSEANQSSRLPPRDEVDDDEMWNIAAEMEAESQAEHAATCVSATNAAPTEQPSIGADWDDMYA